MTRRYDESEIAEILRRATELEVEPEVAGASATALAPGAVRGLTLAEVQEIAGEVGIGASAIQRAARSLDSTPSRPPVRFLGAPRSVAHTVPLPRDMTDEEWHRTVALLRETFGAKGEVEALGPLRTWHNGNLQVHVEPGDGGYRLRMYTYKGSVAELTTAAVAIMVVGLIMAMAIFGKRGVDLALLFPAMFEAFGLGMLGVSRFGLPRWAAERQAQFEALGQRVSQLLEAHSGAVSQPPPGDP